jgi:sec-independent protein translocase protein TatB
VIDFGFDKLALIGAVALIVIGPEKLPRVARTVGHMLGKAQRYVADVKAEVNRSIELDELKKMKTQFEDAARDVEKSVGDSVQQVNDSMQTSWSELQSPPVDPADRPAPQYKHPKKRWRLKRGATPQWYKQRQGIRTRAQSGAARVARFRPPGVGPR